MTEETVGDCLRCGKPVAKKDLRKIRRSNADIESPYHEWCLAERMWDLFNAYVTSVVSKPEVHG